MITHKGHEIREMIRHQRGSELLNNSPYKYHCKCVETSMENMHTDPLMFNLFNLSKLV